MRLRILLVIVTALVAANASAQDPPQPPGQMSPPRSDGYKGEREFDPRYSDVYTYPQHKGADGITHVIIGAPIQLRIRVRNNCSWPQVVSWEGDGETVSPGDAMLFKQNPPTAQHMSGEPDSFTASFTHRLTRVVNGHTKVCSGSANAVWIVEWNAPKPGALPPASAQSLDPVDVTLTETDGGEAPTEPKTSTEPIPPTTPPAGDPKDGVPPERMFDPRYSDTYSFPVHRDPDGVSHAVVGTPIRMRIRVTNKCSWPQDVQWEGDADTVAPGDGKFFRSPSSTSRPSPGEPETFDSTFTHRATIVVNGVTKTCQGSGSAKWIVEWIAPKPGMLPPASPQVLDPVEIVLTETLTAGVTTETRIPTQPLDPAPPAVGLGGVGTFEECFGAVDCTPFSSVVQPWTAGLPDGWDPGFQYIGGEAPRVRIDVTIQQASASPRGLNPLGLLSKSVDRFINWWMPVLDAAEQSLQQGLQFLITSQGGSTGKNLTMQALNFTGKPIRLDGAIALEPLKKDAQQKATQAFAKLAGRALPTKVDLNGYCFEFLKLPPVAGQVMRVAPPEVQKRFEPLKKVMAAANRVMQTGGLHPDSNPAAYGDSIKQWAIWTVQEKFDQSKFADAFVNHTKKNVEAAGQRWSSQIEAAIRQAAPNRWNDIAQILKLSGVPR